MATYINKLLLTIRNMAMNPVQETKLIHFFCDYFDDANFDFTEINERLLQTEIHNHLASSGKFHRDKLRVYSAEITRMLLTDDYCLPALDEMKERVRIMYSTCPDASNSYTKLIESSRLVNLQVANNSLTNMCIKLQKAVQNNTNAAADLSNVACD